jgi:hypothetical protein
MRRYTEPQTIHYLNGSYTIERVCEGRWEWQVNGTWEKGIAKSEDEARERARETIRMNCR